MPCRSDYMDPTAKETYCRNTALNLLYAIETAMPKKYYVVDIETLKKNAKDDYCKVDYTEELCSFLKSLNKTQLNNLTKTKSIHSAHLNSWWIAHQEGEARREQEDIERLKRENIRLRAFSKLTKEEIEALGL